MAFDPTGEGGLRRRLRVATEEAGSRPGVAATLGISEATLSNYLDNPEYVLTSDTFAAIVENLHLLPMRDHTRTASANYSIVFHEKPQWTQGDIDTFRVEPTVEKVVCFVFDPNYPDRVASSGPYAMNTFTVQQAIDFSTGGNPNLLLTVVTYVPLVEYPYPSNL